MRRHIVPLLPAGNEDIGEIRLALTPSSTDSADLVDSSTEVFALTASGTDSYISGNVDADTEVFKLTSSATEIREHSDAQTEIFSFGPIALEGQYRTDSGTELLALSVLTHECYAIATPEYSVEIMKRWNMGTPFKSWEVTSLSKRWNTYIVDAGIAIPC